jgi:coenzyme F420 hydrogenase subunit beta
MRQQSNLRVGVRQVIEHELCIGCGACTTIGKSAKIEFNRYGELTANVSACSESEIRSMATVCPFSSSAPNETALAKVAFKNENNIQISHEIGAFNGLYAGFSTTYRKWGSSGGIVGWVLAELLKQQLVDKVIVVGRSSEGDRFFDFKVIADIVDLQKTGTSFYYPVSYDKVLSYIAENPGRYAITGVPCFHRALRQIKAVNPVIAERVVYQIGIVCGQMKSSFYLDYLARKAGIDGPPESACFRRKQNSARADDYLFEASFKNSSGETETRSIRNSEIGSNWALGLFKPRACDFCDDVFAETADIAVMDAWLDKYVQDGKGTSIVVTRIDFLSRLLRDGMASSSLYLESISAQEVVESQRGGLNHRRAGLGYRLFLANKNDLAPLKRIKPNSRLDWWFKIEQRMRSAIRAKSRVAMRKQIDSAQGDLAIYDAEMRRLLWLHRWFNRLKTRISSRKLYDAKFSLDN